MSSCAEAWGGAAARVAQGLELEPELFVFSEPCSVVSPQCFLFDLKTVLRSF